MTVKLSRPNQWGRGMDPLVDNKRYGFGVYRSTSLGLH